MRHTAHSNQGPKTRAARAMTGQRSDGTLCPQHAWKQRSSQQPSTRLGGMANPRALIVMDISRVLAHNSRAPTDIVKELPNSRSLLDTHMWQLLLLTTHVLCRLTGLYWTYTYECPCEVFCNPVPSIGTNLASTPACRITSIKVAALDNGVTLSLVPCINNTGTRIFATLSTEVNRSKQHNERAAQTSEQTVRMAEAIAPASTTAATGSSNDDAKSTVNAVPSDEP